MSTVLPRQLNSFRIKKAATMKTRSLFRRALLACSIALIFSHSQKAQELPERQRPDEAEIKAAKAVEAAPDINAKMVAAEDFVKKYPKSVARKRVAQYLADQIAGEKDANQKLALAQKALAIFSGEEEANLIKPRLIDAYIKLNRLDEAFNEGAAFLAKNPDNVHVLVSLTIAGTEQAKQRNTKFVAQARQYGNKATELLEADQAPAGVDAEGWNRNKAMLPQVYQELAILSLLQQNATDAQGKLDKASKLNPSDPFNYLLMGTITNDEYQNVAQTYKNMPDGKAKEDMLAKANSLIDKIIDQYAHAVALSEGKPEYQKLHDEVLSDLTSYYKYRHHSSTEGMQQLIDKFKTATP
jgi:hypothetical protein